MLRFLFIFGFWLAAQSVQAASIDCKNPTHPVDEALCSQYFVAAIEAIEEHFSYFQKRTTNGDSFFADKQQQWFQKTREDCASDLLNIISCVEKYYDARFYDWRYNHNDPDNHPSFSLGYNGKFPVLPVLWGKGILKNYDFGFFITAILCENYEGDCPGIYLGIFTETDDMPRQFLDVSPYFTSPASLECISSISENCSDIFVKETGEQVTPENLADLIDVADFNFDGFQDFAFRYAQDDDGERKYWVFLYNPEDGLFYYAPSFTQTYSYNEYDACAAKEYRLDEEKGEIIAYTSGEGTAINTQCSLEEIYYRAEGLVPLRRTFKEFSDENKDGVITHEDVWQDNKWQPVKTQD